MAKKGWAVLLNGCEFRPVFRPNYALKIARSWGGPKKIKTNRSI